MLLRRITEHVKVQNWFAVGLDFLIVVVGVFIGIQVANWNDARAERAALVQQFESLRIEMEGNHDEIRSHKETINGQLRDIKAIRTSFASGENAVSNDRLNAQLLNMFRVAQFNLDTDAYDELADSGGLRRISGTPLRAAIMDWQSARAEVERINVDALTFRQSMMGDLLETLAFGGLIDSFDPVQPYKVPARFQNDFDTLVNNRKFASFLALRMGVEAQKLVFVERLEAKTQALIDLLLAAEADQ